MTLTLGAEQIPLRRDDYGSIRVSQTRVTLESIAYCFKEGASPEEIVEAYPAVSISDVYLVLGYCLRHPDELNEYLAQQRQHAQESRERDEIRFNTSGLRERLLARQSQRNGK